MNFRITSYVLKEWIFISHDKSPSSPVKIFLIALTNEFIYVSLLLLTLFLLLVMANTKINPGAYISNTLMIWPLYALVLIICFSVFLNVTLSVLITLKVI